MDITKEMLSQNQRPLNDKRETLIYVEGFVNLVLLYVEQSSSKGKKI